MGEPSIPRLAALAVALVLSARARAEDGAATRDAEVRAALARELAFKYVETPLKEVLPDIAARSGAEIALAHEATECMGDCPITWSSKRSSAERALRWVTRLGDLDFRVLDGGVLVSMPEKLRGEVTLRVYNVRDLVRGEHAEARPGPRVAFSPLERRRRETDEIVVPPSIAETVMARLRPGEWAGELGTSVEERDGLLIVMQRPDVHALVQRFISGLRAVRRRPVRVEVVVLDAAAAGPVLGEAEGTALASERVEALLAGAEEGVVVAHAEVSTLEGLTAHVVWGAKTHYIESKRLVWPEVEVSEDHEREIRHEVIPVEDDMPKVLVVKTPAPVPAAPPPGEGVLVPVVDAILDGVLVEVTPRLLRDAAGEPAGAELDLRVVISHPRRVPEADGPGEEGISEPTVDYSRLATTARLPVGPFGLVGKMAVRRGARDVPVAVLACVAAQGSGR